MGFSDGICMTGQEPGRIEKGMVPRTYYVLARGVWPIFFRRKINRARATSGPKQVPLPHDYREIKPSLKENEAHLRQEFGNTTDIVFRGFFVGETRCLAVWVDGLINNRVSHDIFRSLMLDVPREELRKVPVPELADYLNQHFLPFYATTRVEDMVELKRWILMGKMVLLVDGCPVGLMLDAETPPMRGMTEPVLESVVVGPRDSFLEPLRINTALIRSRLGDVRLKSENFILGRRSNTLVTLMYVEDLANPLIVEEARQRISRVDIDGILDSSVLKELIQDKKYSLFPLMKISERPDKVVADLLEGRFAIIVDGSPQVLTAPTLFQEFLQSAEDYYLNPLAVWLIRMLRYLALFMASNLPGLYVAVTTFHQEMLPIPLVFSVAGARETVPFPAFFEALTILTIFELLWEAGVRLPRVVGAAVNIVGALILGQAAVQAGLVSQALVIVIGATAISNFALGSGYELASGIRLVRFAVLILGAVLGLYGIALSFLAFLIHLAGLRSFGVPYMAPWAPLRWDEMEDALYRAPWWDMSIRPELIAGQNHTRSKTPSPGPPPTTRAPETKKNQP